MPCAEDFAFWLRAIASSELLPVTYYHLVFTLPQPVAVLAFYNQRTVYDILFRTSAQTLLTIGRDGRHLGAQLGFFSVLHTWGQNLLYHPHVHCVAAGGGPSSDGRRWVACRPGFFLPVRVLSRLFRRLFLEALQRAFTTGRLRFLPAIRALQSRAIFQDWVHALNKTEWVVYAKAPVGGPQQVLEYLGRYTHRVAIANERLLHADDQQVSFRWKDYRHPQRPKTMTLSGSEFLRRFLLHILPPGFPRIRHYGWLANRRRRENLALCRALLRAPVCELLPEAAGQDPVRLLEFLTGRDLRVCPMCGIGHMEIIERLPPVPWLDSS